MIGDGTMTILRVLVGGAVIAFCAGFIPVSGCAKGCGAAGKVGARHGDDFARFGTRGAAHYGDDIARGAGRGDLGRAGRYRPGFAVGGVGHGADDLAFASRMELESAVRSLPEPDGAISALARKPTASGMKLDGLDTAGRNFGKDYAKAADGIGVTKKQHQSLMDAFETAQEFAEPLIEALAGDEEPGADADAIRASVDARDNMQAVAAALEVRLAGILTPEQLRKFRAELGPALVVAYRLAKDRPVQKAKATSTNDKVAP
jgi:hypothetical protein